MLTSTTRKKENCSCSLIEGREGERGNITFSGHGSPLSLLGELEVQGLQSTPRCTKNVQTHLCVSSYSLSVDLWGSSTRGASGDTYCWLADKMSNSSNSISELKFCTKRTHQELRVKMRMIEGWWLTGLEKFSITKYRKGNFGIPEAISAKSKA